MNDIKMTGFDPETFDRIKKNISDLLPSSPNDDDTTKSPTNVELYNQIYGNRDISDGAKGNKISALRRGDGISLNDIIKIAAWKSLSLDWLILGKGNPPPELQSKEGNTTDDEPEPGNTVRGLLYALMHLSLAEYIHDFKIDTHTHDYCYHNVNISFSILPFDEDELKDYYQCDSSTYLMQGLRNLSDPQLLNSRKSNEEWISARISEYNKILNDIPGKQFLWDYSDGLFIHESVTAAEQGYFEMPFPEKY